MPMDLQAPLGDILDDFLYCEIARVLHQAASLEAGIETSSGEDEGCVLFDQSALSLGEL